MPPFLSPSAGVLAAYLLGSLSFAMLAAASSASPIRAVMVPATPARPTSCAAATRAPRSLTLLGDAGKGWLAVFLASRMPPLRARQLRGRAGRAGRLLRPPLPGLPRFKGGKGVATAAGVLLAINLWLGLATLGHLAVHRLSLRYSSLAALVTAAAAPLYALLIWGNDGRVLVVGIIAMALIGKHWQNLQRLMAGSEPKIGRRK
jgi:glycerol-3-phosphate acyltransferase PlsY